MNNRLKDIIRYKTNGRQKDFADMMGWKPQYVNNLLKGSSIGLQPIVAILRKCPEIDARWFLLGEGSMLLADKVAELREQALNHIKVILDLETFIPVMSPDELNRYQSMLAGEASHPFDNDPRLRWLSQMAERQMQTDLRLRQAMDESDELCRQQTAKS